MSHKPQILESMCCVNTIYIYISIYMSQQQTSSLRPGACIASDFLQGLGIEMPPPVQGESTFDGEGMIKQVFWTCGKPITLNGEGNCNKNILETKCHYTRTLFMLCTTPGGTHTHTQKLVACLPPHEIPRCCFILHGDFFSGVNGLGIPPVTRKHAGIV